MVQRRKSRRSRMGSVIQFLSRLSPFACQNEEKPWEGISASLSSIFKRDKAEWVLPFLSASYFAKCQKHSNVRENSLKYFCTECPDSGPICKTCKLEDHADHKCLKLSKYSTSGIVRGSHSGCIDTSDVYPYISSGKSSYFLRSDRPKAHTRNCLVCHRTFSNRKVHIPMDSKPKHQREMRKVQQERNRAKYCSLKCKFEDLLRSGKPLDAFINNKFDYRDYRTDSDDDDEDEDGEDDQIGDNNDSISISDKYISDGDDEDNGDDDDEEEEEEDEEEEEEEETDDTVTEEQEEQKHQKVDGSEEDLDTEDKCQKDEEAKQKDNGQRHKTLRSFNITENKETRSCRSMSRKMIRARSSEKKQNEGELSSSKRQKKSSEEDDETNRSRSTIDSIHDSPP